MAHRGAWGQVIVAATLISIVPALTLAWFWSEHVRGAVFSRATLWGSAGALVFVMALGYALLTKYPVSIKRLRRYLSTLAENGIPDAIHLAHDEDDLGAIERHMQAIVQIAAERIALLEHQHATDIAAERQRVMVESIGSMCHYLGQPTTVLEMSLYRLREQVPPGQAEKLIQDCEDALENMRNTFTKLRGIATYASEAYLTDTHADNPTSRIVKLNPEVPPL